MKKTKKFPAKGKEPLTALAQWLRHKAVCPYIVIEQKSEKPDKKAETQPSESEDQATRMDIECSNFIAELETHIETFSALSTLNQPLG